MSATHINSKLHLYIMKNEIFLTLLAVSFALSSIFFSSGSFAQVANLSPQVNTGNGIPQAPNANGIQSSQQGGAITNVPGVPCPTNVNSTFTPVNGLQNSTNLQTNNLPLQNNTIGGNLTNPCTSIAGLGNSSSSNNIANQGIVPGQVNPPTSSGP